MSQGIDATTWAVIAAVLTVLLALGTWTAWRRRGPASGLKWAGVTLVPVAAWLTGTMRLLAEISVDVSRWATGLLLSPRVWVGLVVLAVGVGLFLLGSAMTGRGVGVRHKGVAVRREVARNQVPATTAASSSRSTAPAPAGRGGAPAPADDGIDDDVSAILRKHGIS